MGPSKRKGSVRRPVLDLNAKDSSPSRLTWQTKYQQVVPNEEIQENGDTSLSQINNPLSSLLGNYNSDSDSEEKVSKPNTALDAKVEDFLKEIHCISVESKNNAQKAESATNQSQTQQEQPLYPSSVTAWQQCYDHNSGYPYYWNTETNEVTWEMPAELKAALTTIAIKQQEQQQLQTQQTIQKPDKQPQIVEETKKKVIKYPWQTESDSEDEKIEMITSFGPQSDEESEGEVQKSKTKKFEKNKKTKSAVGLQYPLGPTGPCMDPNKIKSDCVSLAPDDSEGLNDTSYETSSLLTHCVQDTGPPGDETFVANKGLIAKKKANNNSTMKKEPPKTETTYKPKSSNDSEKSSYAKTENNLLIETCTSEVNQSANVEVHSTDEIDDKRYGNVDDIVAQIEKETPPDYTQDVMSEKVTPESGGETPAEVNSKSSGIALIANYGEDSETEDNTSNSEKKNTSSKKAQTPVKSLFPIEIPQEEKGDTQMKPLFPCIEAETCKATGVEILRPKVSTQDELLDTVSNIYNADMEAPDASSHKAFKRKKRLEFATTIYGPSTSKLPEVKSSSPERPVGISNSQYNMDPSMNEHRGFGFTSLRNETDSERKTYKNSGGIKFIKAETINPSAVVTEPKEKEESEAETPSAPPKSVKESELEKEIEEAATLLREKVTFLTGGNSSIPPIQYMAIELETLVLAWQQGALTPPYLLRWLNDKCAELIRHEKSAAPTGWTCLWDRKNKRYYYRNSTTKVTQWDYPSVEEKVKGKEGDVVGGGDEMDICDTPPHMSPAGSDKNTDVPVSTPPPPVASEASESVLSQSQVPPPPQISFYPEKETTAVQAKKKRKRKLENKSTEGDRNESVPKAPLTSYDQVSEFNEVAPPLPPLPPPPPPPPDESPPPLPNSPPPLPLDPDQPLPPGVDEPEYALYRRTSPKHSYKKAQNESSAYSAELMMSYGYGYSSNGQPITLQMQPLDYHTYMHEPVSNSYLVQSAPTSHVLQCSAKKPKVSLNSELMSFYSDLALLDASSNENSNPPNEPQPVSTTAASSHEQTAVTTVTATTTAPVVSTIASTAVSSATVSKAADTVTSNGLNIKKKKKVKSTTGLALKKRGVSSLVAKWQQVQQEVRKDFSDDDDEGVAR